MLMSDTIKSDSLITLHYRVATGDDVELVSTFDSPRRPPCRWAAANWRRPWSTAWSGWPSANAMFSCWNPNRPSAVTTRNWCSASAWPTCRRNASPELHGLIEFASPAGRKVHRHRARTGREAVLVDFNHPLAGKHVRFEVELIGIL
jgi:FKBP-type peptidyl-prolyl cis-trans isomerase SlpA